MQKFEIYRYGLSGFYNDDHKPMQLTRKEVEGIHLKGGTILGTSRGGADMKAIVHRIKLWGLNMVFVIGGNGKRPIPPASPDASCHQIQPTSSSRYCESV